MLIAKGQHSAPTAALIGTTTEDLRYKSGFPGLLTDIPSCVLEHVSTKSWIQVLTLFVITSEIVLQDPHPRLLPKRCCDVFLVEHFVQ